jgi:hypothetical protein
MSKLMVAWKTRPTSSVEEWELTSACNWRTDRQACFGFVQPVYPRSTSNLFAEPHAREPEEVAGGSNCSPRKAIDVISTHP